MLLASTDEMAYSNFIASPGKAQSVCAFLKVPITVPFRSVPFRTEERALLDK
jgi:hypothetical protein